MGIGQETPERSRVSAAGVQFWRYAAWLERLCLAAPMLLFLRIGWKYLSDPAETAARSRIVLGSPEAVTDMRAFGAIFLAFAAIALVSLVSTRRLLTGSMVIALVLGCAIVARALGIVADGAAPETTFKLIAEVVLLLLAIAAIWLELRRRRQARSHEK